MWITHRNRRCTEIDDWVFCRLLSFYPEEELLSRSVLSKALAQRAYATGKITANQAQYVLFGRVRKATWRKYKAQVGL